MANSELLELDRLKDNFISLVSHELRTPISSIVAYAEILSIEGMVEPEDRDEFTGIIHKEALNLSEMIGNVLTISKIESGHMLFEFQEGNLRDMVDSAIATLNSRDDLKEVKISSQIATQISSTPFDEDKIRILLHQILDNAVKFTERGSITARLSQSGDKSLIEIQDTGSGMDEIVMANPFNKFHRLGDNTNRNRGIGLGLPLSYLIVKAHSGDIQIESSENEGTTISVWLPHNPAPKESPNRPIPGK